MAKRINSVNKKEDDTILFAFLATFLSIIGFIIALAVKRDNKYVMYYAKQSLVVFIVMAVLGTIAKIFHFLPIAGEIIWGAVTIVCVILWVISWLYALSGEMREVPVVGLYARNLKF